MTVKFKKPTLMTEAETHYCPGCSHGIAHRLIAEVIEELGFSDRAILVGPIGCSVFIYKYLSLDAQMTAHGRAPAAATAVKRLLSDRLVFTYQGDGDLASIGLSEIMHAAARRENFTTIFINNGIYGMTGGQMAPTTLVGQKTTTSPEGRRAEQAGFPLDMSVIISNIAGAAYVARASLHDVKHILTAKKYIRTAFEHQLAGRGFSLVECLSICPTNWRLSPSDSLAWLTERMIPAFPLGVKKGA